MIAPISNARAGETEKDSHPPAAKPYHPQTQAPVTVKNGEVSTDQLTLKSAGDVNNDNK